MIFFILCFIRKVFFLKGVIKINYLNIWALKGFIKSFNRVINPSPSSIHVEAYLTKISIYIAYCHEHCGGTRDKSMFLPSAKACFYSLKSMNRFLNEF